MRSEIVQLYLRLRQWAQIVFQRHNDPLKSAPAPCEVERLVIPRSQIAKVPPELFKRIFSYLPVLDQICFALSYKRAYAYYYSFLRARGLYIHQLLRAQRPVLCQNGSMEKKARVRLLRRLENDRWKFCFGCWTLHPRAAWQKPKKPDCFDCRLLTKQHRCMPYAGIVDICPCLSVTIHDLRDLIKAMESERHNENAGPKDFYHGVVQYQGGSCKGLWHTCTIADHPYATTEIQTRVLINADHATLHVVNWYAFHIFAQEFPCDAETPFLCPHNDTEEWLKQFFKDAGLRFLGWQNVKTRPKSCLIEFKRGTEPRDFEIFVSRELGEGAWPNKYWDRMCHY